MEASLRLMFLALETLNGWIRTTRKVVACLSLVIIFYILYITCDNYFVRFDELLYEKKIRSVNSYFCVVVILLIKYMLMSTDYFAHVDLHRVMMENTPRTYFSRARDKLFCGIIFPVLKKIDYLFLDRFVSVLPNFTFDFFNWRWLSIGDFSKGRFLVWPSQKDKVKKSASPTEASLWSLHRKLLTHSSITIMSQRD